MNRLIALLLAMFTASSAFAGHWCDALAADPPNENPLLVAEQTKQCELSKKPGARLGATAKWVRESSSWGEPDHINTTITPRGRFEQWVYDDNQYLYFTNGRLTGIQQ